MTRSTFASVKLVVKLHHADDTVLMVGRDNESITNMKFILYCFEWMSGLKINYHKSELTVFGVDDARQSEIANMLNCQIGSLPFKYLSLPIHDRPLPASSFDSIVGKMRNRLQP